MSTLQEIWFYPLKAFPGIKKEQVILTTGEGIANDRRYAITRTVSDNKNGDWLTCRSFFINSICDGLLRFSTSLDDNRLTLTSPEGITISLDFNEPATIAIANQQLSDVITSLNPAADNPVPMICERRQTAGEHSSFWDFTDSAISLINKASIDAIGDCLDARLDYRRFRGNFLLDNLNPWEEFTWIGKRICIGSAELEVIRPAMRCPATSVNPQTGERDQKIPDNLQSKFGHGFCGVYARVVKSGTVNINDPIEIIADGELSLEKASSNNAPDYRLWPKTAKITDISDGRISIEASIPWPLPQAQKGQKIRVHSGVENWTSLKVISHKNNRTVLAVTKNQLEKLYTGLGPNKLLVSGPFGKAD